MVGSIRVGRYDWKHKKQPHTPGYKNVLIHTTGPLSPYEMTDSNGVIMETYWQMHKIWTSVAAQNQPLSRFNRKIKRWEHPAEVHIDDQNNITPQYWAWRAKGFKNPRWIRYPNGFHNHGSAIGSVLGGPPPLSHKIVGYIEARKKIYFQKYREIALQTDEFKRLQALLNSGVNIQINEVDGPKEGMAHPYNLVQSGSLEMTPKILIDLINNPEQPFGHGYALAACLLGVDLANC